jgi:hypothetical protein
MIFVLRSRIKLDVSLGLQRPFSCRLVGDEEVKVRPALHRFAECGSHLENRKTECNNPQSACGPTGDHLLAGNNPAAGWWGSQRSGC